MKFLLDENTSRKFIGKSTSIVFVHQEDMGWKGEKNGNLLNLAQKAGFQAIITVDKGMRYQQNLTGKGISIITLDIHPASPRNQLACLNDIEDLLTNFQTEQTYTVEGPNSTRHS